MARLKVNAAFKAPVGTHATVKGWVRTNRESKADGGLCFVAVSDGSCFDAIQCVVKSGVPGFDDVRRLTTGCALEVDGELVASQGKGASQGKADPVAGQAPDRALERKKFLGLF